MSSLYIHIPFCRTRCIYCDFCSSTLGVDEQAAYAEALCSEIANRQCEAGNEPIHSIYFGGGTPSMLNLRLLEKILSSLRQTFRIEADAEVTIEANPDDINLSRIEGWMRLGFNRLSLGVQSLNDDMLQLLHRRHTAQQAIEAVQMAQQAGMSNISIDLMYGLPSLSLSAWDDTLSRTLSLPVTHLSAYCLTIEQRTPIAQAIQDGSLSLPEDEQYEAAYRLLVERTRQAGFVHYEISNFAREGYRSRHNSGYWNGTPYIGLGAGAHSFDGSVRRANTTDVKAYILSDGHPVCEMEQLSRTAQINEMIFLSLRTANGLHTDIFQQRFGTASLEQLLKQAQKHILAGKLTLQHNVLRLSADGVFVSDDIMSDLIFID